MTGANDNIAYLLNQKVRQRQFVADGMPEVREEYERTALLLVSQISAMGRWRRTFEEYESSNPFLESLRRQPTVERGMLREKHMEAMEGRQFEFGLMFPLEVESDAANVTAVMPSTQPIPLPFYVLYLPT